MKSRLISLAVVSILAALAAAPARAGAGLTVRDMAGRTVSLPRPPERIACLGPGALRLIVYLQAQNRVAGIEDMEKKFPKTRPYYIANPRFGRLPSVGPGGPAAINKEPDYEKLLAVKPDLIFVTYTEPGLADQVQRKLGLPLFVLTYGPFGSFSDKVFDSIMAAGRVLGGEERARAVVDYIKDQRQDLRKRAAGFPEDQKPLAYIGGIGFKGTHGIESTETEYPPFEWIAARNAAREVVCYHDDCYTLYKAMAPEFGIDVPFEPISWPEFLYRRMKALEDRTRPLNRPVAYQRPCASRYTPEKDPFVDRLFELIGAPKPARSYEGENAFCCGGGIVPRDYELSNRIKHQNLKDARDAGAEIMVTLCPMCFMNLKKRAPQHGLALAPISDLCRAALGEIEIG